MPDIPSSLTFSSDGFTYAILCVDLTVYWRGSAFHRADGIVHFYRRSIQEIGERLRYYETGTMSGAKRLRKDTLEMVPFWFQKAKARRDIYMMSLESGAQANEPSDAGFFIIADEEDDEPIGAAQIRLPVSYVEKSPARLVDLARDLVAKLEFESGHGGYTLNWDPRGDFTVEAQEAMESVAARFPGVDLFDMDVTLVAMRKTKPAGIKRVNWLTLLGKSLAEALGHDKLRQSLNEACEITKLPTGLLIRAGDRPTTGDQKAARTDLTAYESVGRVLARLRFVDHRRIFGSSRAGAPDPTSSWLARFD